MKKGFTLIELLAVIVILAVIALIATPLIMGVIEDAKKSSAESSAIGYIDAVEKQVAINLLDTDSDNDILDNKYTVLDLKDKSIFVKGEIPSDESWVQIEKGQVTECLLKLKEYTYNCNGSIIKNDDSDENRPSFGPTMLNAGESFDYENGLYTDTHKGVIYLDPTDLTKTCTKNDVDENYTTNGITNNKTGCMKWYIYDDAGDNYKMILDHNTTALVKWNNDNKNVAYESSNIYSVVQELKTTSGWVVDPRLMSVEEVNSITEQNNFDSSNKASWYFLDNKDQTKTISTKGASKYSWLFNYTSGCENSGCNSQDNNSYTVLGTSTNASIYGYWLDTTVGTANSSTNVWVIHCGGILHSFGSNSNYLGIRPAITIPKSIISSVSNKEQPIIPKFYSDSWTTVIANIKSNNISEYNVGDIKSIDMGSFGIQKVRLSNKANCDETILSETACGVVLEFVDAFVKNSINTTATNEGGWETSYMRNYVNNDIYNAFPVEIKNAIKDTKVVSGYGNSNDEANFITTDKLYLLNPREVRNTNKYDTSNADTRQLEYYSNLGVSDSNYSGAIKYFNGSACMWWLRSATFYGTNSFINFDSYGGLNYNSANNSYGVSPAFRI